jgi:hypothetical protein
MITPKADQTINRNDPLHITASKSFAGVGKTMKIRLLLIALIGSAGFVWGQNPAPSASTPPAIAPCSKNVSFAVAEGGQPVPAIPKFASKWLEGKTQRQHYGSICFSQIPSPSLPNYIIVFSTSEEAFDGLTPSAHTYTTAAPAQASAAAISSSGGTWSYAYSGATPRPTTDTLSLKRDDKPKALDARAYDQSGKAIAHYSLATISSRDKLLERILADILADSPHTGSRTSVPSPFSVYYVNCDVDSPSASPPINSPGLVAAAAHPEPAAGPKAPPPPPDPELDIWSSPSGADIFVDGQYVGKTPYSMSVAQGEHTVSIRKKDFDMWQRKLTVSGTRKVGGNLAQRELDLK